jgi:hypothetical protein
MSEGNAPGNRANAGRFKPGQSGNPSGHSKSRREMRAKVQAALDEAFAEPDGTDTLVKAIVFGVQTGDSTCLRLACEYRWGKPETDVNIHEGSGDPLNLAQIREAADAILSDPEKRRELRAAIRGEN